MKLWYLLIGLAAGTLIPMQAPINNQLSKIFGGQPLFASFISFSVGAIVLGIASAILVDWQLVQAGWSEVSLNGAWKWIGGALGAGFVFVSVFLAPKIGVANMMFLLILGQLLMSVVIDRFGWFGLPVRDLPWTKILGLLLMIIGVVTFVLADRPTK